VSSTEGSSGRILRVLPGTYAICRLGPQQQVPSWALAAASEFTSVTRSRDELSIICPADALPADALPADALPDGSHPGKDWHCLRIEGASALDEPGVLVSVAGPLANAQVSVFAVATYDTDYLLVNDIDSAIAALRQAGHQVIPGSPFCPLAEERPLTEERDVTT
jgi:hypothetical protein